MKRAIFFYSLMFICLASGIIVFGQTKARKSCPFSIIGMWKSEAATETSPASLNFSPDGWVRLLDHSTNTHPQDFEVIAEVRYKLDKPSTPKRIEFTATRGNDVFSGGTTSMEVTEYSDNSFTTTNLASGRQTRWVRVQTHRYFLTFAARRGGPAFAMWIKLDGRQTQIEALGLQSTRDDAGRVVPIFGPIPAEVHNEFTTESDKDSDAMLRLELTEAEFGRTRKVFEIWEERAKNKSLPGGDPYLNSMEFLRRVAESLNQCDEKIKLHNLARHVLEYVKALRKKNEALHVTDPMFPKDWQPMPGP